MPDGLSALATAYRLVYGIVGCRPVARLAPDHPARHAWALAGIAMNPLCAWAGAELAAR